MMNQKRGHRYNKLPGDGVPWATNNINGNLEQKATPVQATDKKLRPQRTKMNSFKSGP